MVAIGKCHTGGRRSRPNAVCEGPAVKLEIAVFHAISDRRALALYQVRAQLLRKYSARECYYYAYTCRVRLSPRIALPHAALQ